MDIFTIMGQEQAAMVAAGLGECSGCLTLHETATLSPSGICHDCSLELPSARCDVCATHVPVAAVIPAEIKMRGGSVKHGVKCATC